MTVTFDSCMAETDVWTLNLSHELVSDAQAYTQGAKKTLCEKIMSLTTPEELEEYATFLQQGNAPKGAEIARRRAYEIRLANTRPTLGISTNSRNPAAEMVSRGTATDPSWNRIGGAAIQAQGAAAGSVEKSSWTTYAWIVGAVIAVAGGGYLAYRYANTGRRHNPAPRGGDMVWTEDGEVFMPDQRILKDKPEFVYRPLRGYSNLLAVFDINDRCIGWISTQTLGYPDVKSWMAATNYIVRGAKRNPTAGMLVSFEDEGANVRVSNSDTSFLVSKAAFDKGMDASGFGPWIGQPEMHMDWEEWSMLLDALSEASSGIARGRRGARKRGPRKINQKDYRYYTIETEHTGAGRSHIVGGSEYREDEQEHASTLKEDVAYVGLTSDYTYRVLGRAAAKREGLDPDNNANWGNPYYVERLGR